MNSNVFLMTIIILNCCSYINMRKQRKEMFNWRNSKWGALDCEAQNSSPGLLLLRISATVCDGSSLIGTYSLNYKQILNCMKVSVYSNQVLTILNFRDPIPKLAVQKQSYNIHLRDNIRNAWRMLARQQRCNSVSWVATGYRWLV